MAAFLRAFPVVSETFILRQLTGLADLGHDVDVFAEAPPTGYASPGAGAGPELAHRIQYISRHGGRPGWSRSAALAAAVTVRAPRALSLLTRRGSAAYGGRRALLPRLRVLLGHRRYDIVHCHFGPLGLRYRFAARYWRAPLVVSFYGHDCSRYPLRHGPGVYAPLFAAADRVIVLSEQMRRRLESLGCPGHLLQVLPLGVDLQAFDYREPRSAFSSGGPRVLTVARLVEKKGVEFALRAVAAAAPSVPEVRYDILGDGPLRPQLEALAQALGLADRVTFHGTAGEDAVRRAMAAADVFLLPSVTAADGDQEGTPTVLLEAAACGLPIVSTLHSGIPEIVRAGQTGLLVPERTVPELAAALQLLLTDGALRVRFGRAGRRMVETGFEIRMLNRRLEGIYRSLLSAYPERLSGERRPGISTRGTSA